MVIGVDKHITYHVDGVIYRNVDLNNSDEIQTFFRDVRQAAKGQGLTMGACYDLATIQTSATDGSNREALVEGKQAIIEALCTSDGDEKLVYMSTAEVYGAPKGAPYLEEHTQEPINVYGRHKRAEEQASEQRSERPREPREAARTAAIARGSAGRSERDGCGGPAGSGAGAAVRGVLVAGYVGLALPEHARAVCAPTHTPRIHHMPRA